MLINRSKWRFISLFVVLGSLFCVVNVTLSLQHDQKINQALQSLNTLTYVDPQQLDLTLPEIRFAYAWHLQQRGLFEDSVEAYSKAELDSSSDLRRVIFYNLGNLYLQQAYRLAESMGIDRAMALADVAKDMYESALKLDPSFWDAKFNLEAAQRLSRDLPLGKIQEDDEAAEGSKELWSAMPGFPVGLP